MKGIASGIVTALASVLLVAGVSTAYAAATTEVGVDTPSEVAPGSSFTAAIRINQVANFDATNYEVFFDPAVLKLERIAEGRIDSTAVPVDIFRSVAAGMVRVIQNVPGLKGASGSGYLAIMEFRVIGSPGQGSTISLNNGVLSNTLAEAIPATWGSGFVRVSGGSAGQSPTPSLPPPPTGTTETPSTSEGSQPTTASAPASSQETAGETSPTPSSSTPVNLSPTDETVKADQPAASPAATPTTPTAPTTPLSPQPQPVRDPETPFASPSPPPADRTGNVNPFALWGGIAGGVAIALGVFIYLRMIRKAA